MGLLRALADAIYKEYDRRIKRASLVKEYGMHHDSHGADHADETHAADEHAAPEDEAEIFNVPRGTPVAAHTPAANESAETAETHE
jgi:hypothetical protein